MKESLFQMNKKAVSIMIGYVLLIIIAVAVSVLVYGFLKAYVPKEKPQCEKELALIIEEVKINCESDVPQSIDVTVNNRGLFKVDAVFIRLEKEGRRVKKFINDPLVDNDYAEDFYLQDNGNPGETFTATDLDLLLVSDPFTPGTYELEVQPAHFTGKGLELALCTPISQTITIVCPTA